MREYLELRVKRKRAAEIFAANEGRELDLVRLVLVPTSDPRLPEIRRLQAEGVLHGDCFFHGWRIIRKYSSLELAKADLFRVTITSVFEPTGEECGTIYDESYSCRHAFSKKSSRSEDLRRKSMICAEWVRSKFPIFSWTPEKFPREILPAP